MIKKCEYCGKEFEQSKRRKRFCCIECYRKFKSVNKIGSEIKYKFLGATTKNSKIYNIWCGILRRCYNKNQRSFNDYGLRGITVCDNWKDFKNFYDWAMVNGYKDGLSIERIDVNGNYCPENCTWITMKEQAKNKTNTIWVNHNGKSMILKDVAILEKLNYKELWSAYKRNDNNLIEALNICSLHKNKLTKSNKSGHRGVYFYKNKWVAYFNQKYIGRFKTFDEAVQARLNAEQGKKKAS